MVFDLPDNRGNNCQPSPPHTLSTMIATAAEHLAIQDRVTSPTEPALLKLIDDGHAHFETTGLHVTTAEVRAWLAAARLNPDAPRPTCHV
jgi:hypothetical protein